MTTKQNQSMIYAMLNKAGKTRGASQVQKRKAHEAMKRDGFTPKGWQDLGLVYWYLDNIIKNDNNIVDTAELMNSQKAIDVAEALPDNASDMEQRLADEETARLRRLADEGEWE